MAEEDEEDEEDAATKKLVSTDSMSPNLDRMAPLSTISEVTLYGDSERLVRMLLTISGVECQSALCVVTCVRLLFGGLYCISKILGLSF